jgi:hypothetical protein
MRTGAAGILVGVGPGAACTTRGVLGIGVPQATAIADARAARMRHLDETGVYVHVIADGYFWDYVHLCTDPARVDWKVEQALCVPRYHGVWDAAKGVCHPVETDCFAWAKFWAGGLTYYGGFIAASVSRAISRPDCVS